MRSSRMGSLGCFPLRGWAMLCLSCRRESEGKRKPSKRERCAVDLMTMCLLLLKYHLQDAQTYVCYRLEVFGKKRKRKKEKRNKHKKVKR